MRHHQRGLLLRGLLAFLGFFLAAESLFLKPNIQIGLPSFPSSGWSDNYDNYDSSPSSPPDYGNTDYDSGGGWDFGSSSDSGWDSGGGGWESGGDSGSWDSGGGDSGSW
jgi:hypothetical protein